MSELPTLYEYYAGNGISTGLTTTPTEFLLNNKSITLFSGALHYFRVHPQQWRDRLRKLRAANLNCVETYFCWNLHEPRPGSYDFGEGKSDFEEFLNVERFLKTVQEEDLLVIARPGPYICAEWDFGGLPSWLLRKPIKVRTSDDCYAKHVAGYFGKLLGILGKYQFTKGGPIIAFQIENEYGNVMEADRPVDVKYLEFLKDLYRKNDIVELLFTSDTPSNGNSGSLPDVLYTANFQDDPEKELSLLKRYQPDRPSMVMEYWSGWFDHWGEKHHTRTDASFSDIFERILKFPSSVNIYMFHGGTNWGFLNGANLKDVTTDNSSYQPDTSSYDYDAPLSEGGDYTEKYFSIKDIVKKYSQIQIKTPEMPALIERVAYDPIVIEEEIDLGNLLVNLKGHRSEKLIPMEMLPVNNDSGQNFGYIVYRIRKINIAAGSVLKIQGHVCDTVTVLVNGELISKIPTTSEDLDDFGFWRRKDSSLSLNGACEDAVLDLLVENMGRVNYGKLDQFNQHKGLWQGPAYLDDVELKDWEIFPLEFGKEWNLGLKNWKKADLNVNGPKLYKGVLDVSMLADTYVDMRSWTKGIVIVNGFVLSRYFKLGPQQACYLPAPFLRSGKNEILIFEHYKPSDTIRFCKDQIYSA